MSGSDPYFFLSGGGEMARAVAAFDWASTPLGPIESWPTELKVVVGMMLASHFPKALVWGPGLVTIYNDAFRPILGRKPEALGRSFAEVWSEVWEEIGPLAEKAFSGEATFIEDFPLVVHRNGFEENAWFTFCYSPVYDEQGRIVGMMDTVVETTSKIEMQRRHELLNRELAHRIKNVLASVAAIANQTLHSSRSIPEAQTALAARLAALATAHGKIMERQQGRVPLIDIVAQTIAAHGGTDRRITLSGPAIELGEKQALALSLAVNELATNALKYGALSVPEGHVEVTWEIVPAEDGDEAFSFLWAETGGPEVTPPKRRSFGSALIETLVPHDFGGTATIDFAPTGLRYAIRTLASNLTGKPS